LVNHQTLHPSLRTALGVPEDISDADFLTHWKQQANRVCKPCWELKYCPYGSLVEQSPLLPYTIEEAIEYYEYSKLCLETGKVLAFDPNDYESDPTGEITIMQMMGHDRDIAMTLETAIHINEFMQNALKIGINGNIEDISEHQREMFEQEILTFDPTEYPKSIPEEITELQCNLFGHICPVVFSAEQITETAELRRAGRYIPFKVKIRVVRRDNYTCQQCGKHLLDNELEFDHIIPVAKGGSSEEHNLQLTCFACNRSKSDLVEFRVR
jgi:HNH endonuclease